MNENWHNASKETPCPVCGHTDWCTMSNDGAVCICRRIASDHPAKSGIGWIHGGEGRSRSEEFRMKENSIIPNSNFQLLHSSFETGDGRMRAMARELGVSVESLRALDVRYNAKSGVMSFPMRNAEGEIVGIRYRRGYDGAKFSERGSRDGLFMPFDSRSSLITSHSSLLTSHFSLLIVEGASDTAAALDLGWGVVGRSSCMTGGDELVKLVRMRGVGQVTIMSDNDPPRRRMVGGVSSPGVGRGEVFSPGYDGAVALAKKLRRETGVTTSIVFPPDGCKDLRQWFALRVGEEGNLRRENALDKVTANLIHYSPC